jgi:L-alanine-DL-glutamate epimerase-like enolase superfamily enzyme
MKISNVETNCLTIPVKIPVNGRTNIQELLLVLVHTDDDITGVGITREPYATRELVDRELAPFLVGKNPIETEKIWKDAAWEIGASYRAMVGVVGRAISAVDQALWDIKGKYLGQPIYRLLGGASPSSIPAYTTFGLNLLTTEELVEAARQLVAEGHDKLKYQAVAADRGQNVSVDAERLKAVREVIGDQVMLIIDGNAKFDFNQAKELLRRIEPYNIGCFDHPVTMRDIHLMAQLRQCTPIPLAARAYSGSLWDNRDLIMGGAVDIMHLNVLDCGGYTACLKVAHMAEMFHLPLATGGAFHSQNAHLIAGVSNGWMTEYHLLVAQATSAIFPDAPKPLGGRLPLPEKPGLGLDLDPAAVKEYSQN